ncbi:IclR family transcriptional regulator [Anaerotignum sp. MB30-C6]|uniref:IclR family transcriptional regulator n=1 Tax=Anaerotignum sp. MB30-C6 TaxID=3070814 RepID=UPI0027DB4015|nr:IclR family transcriptional regulator [Anaerotignum sp. MB30-C6]WMI82142.1 IclR family transcriptional regulator [Anaerotignum sp. MB30-C6]
MDADSKRENYVKSIFKAFQIIEELNKFGELSIGELSQALSMDKGTVHRLVNTIKEAGYIVQNPFSRKYANSIKLFTIGNRIIERTSIKEIARPYIEAVAEETKETINLCMHSGINIVYIDKMESNSAIKVGIEVGTALPMYCTGMGKAILAFLPQEELFKIIENTSFKKRTAKTVSSKEELLQQLELVRQNGYAEDGEEYVDGLISFAAPIFDYRNHPVAAISISMPKLRYKEEEQRQYYVNLVKNTAETLSNELGHKR